MSKFRPRSASPATTGTDTRPAPPTRGSSSASSRYEDEYDHELRIYGLYEPQRPSYGLPQPVIKRVLVAIPAHNEEQYLKASLDAVRRARAFLHDRQPDIKCEIVVAADTCRDRTVAIARQARVITTACFFKRVGATRAHAISYGLRFLGWQENDPKLLICNVDADTVVSKEWIIQHVSVANKGADFSLGIGEPPAGVPLEPLLRAGLMLETWDGSHGTMGASNLAMRGTAYHAVGGWDKDCQAGDDYRLWETLRSHPRRFWLVMTPDHPVKYSFRRKARIPTGPETFSWSVRRFREEKRKFRVERRARRAESGRGHGSPGADYKAG